MKLLVKGGYICINALFVMCLAIIALPFLTVAALCRFYNFAQRQVVFGGDEREQKNTTGAIAE